MPLLHLLALAELDSPNLAARRFREVGDELYAARVLVRGGVRLAVVLNVLRQGVGRLVVLAHDDVSLHHAAPVLVRRGYDGALDYRGVLDQNALHLERPDAVAGRENNVVRSAHEPEASVGVPVGPISGQIEAVAEGQLGRFRLLPVLLEETGDAAVEADVAGLIWRALLAFHVHDLYVAAGRRLAHRARTHREARVVGDEQGVLGLTVAVIDRESVQLFPPLYDRWVQGLAGGDNVTDGGEIRPFELGVLSEEAVLGGGLAQDGDAVALYEGETFGGVEAALVNEDLGPLAPRSQKDVPDALIPSRAGG